MNWANTNKNAKIGAPRPATPGPSPRHRRRRRSMVSHARTEAGRLLFGFRSIDLYSQNGRGSDRDTFPLTRPSVLGNPLRIMTFRKGQPPISGTRKKSPRGKGRRPELRVNIRPPRPFASTEPHAIKIFLYGWEPDRSATRYFVPVLPEWVSRRR